MPQDWSKLKLAATGGAKMAWGSALEMPAVKGALVGAGIGAAWGAVSDREGIVTGAMKGAVIGGLARTGWNYGKDIPKLAGMYSRLSVMSKLSQAQNWRSNLKSAWGFMGRKGNRLGTAVIGGAAAFHATAGLFSTDDNPIGGAIGGGVAGAIQGGAIYGGIKLAKRWKR